jgi:ADP-ribose pyrophosphatase
VSDERHPRAHWSRVATRRAFECPWFSVRQDDIRLPGGEHITYNVLEHAGWALVVPVRADGLVVMERVYRWTVDDWLLECPSGGLDGQAPETAARRELEEETGYRAGGLEHLGHFVASDGYSNERYDAYLARDVTPDGVVEREPTEEIELELHPMSELRELALRGGIRDAPTALAILLAAERLQDSELDGPDGSQP